MNGRSYFRLDRRILTSSVWARDPDTLKVWLYLLLAQDSTGRVEAVPPAIATACGLPLDRVREILNDLASPDPDSRTPTDEGRRIRIHREPEYLIELVNAEKYASMAYGQTAAARQQRYRERRKAERDVTRDAHNVTGDAIRMRIRMREKDLPASSDAGGDFPPSGQKRRKAPNPDIKRLIDHYAAEYEQRFGAKPVVNGASARAAQTLLAGRDLEEAQWLVTEFLADPPGIYGDRRLLDLKHIPGAANTVLARERT